jgi:hypothetical protein
MQGRCSSRPMHVISTLNVRFCTVQLMSLLLWRQSCIQVTGMRRGGEGGLMPWGLGIFNVFPQHMHGRLRSTHCYDCAIVLNMAVGEATEPSKTSSRAQRALVWMGSKFVGRAIFFTASDIHDGCDVAPSYTHTHGKTCNSGK